MENDQGQGFLLHYHLIRHWNCNLSFELKKFWFFPLKVTNLGCSLFFRIWIWISNISIWPFRIEMPLMIGSLLKARKLPLSKLRMLSFCGVIICAG